MSKKLVIVESPAKARTIGRYLGSGFVVRASMGHVRDLPEKRLGVDIEKGFKCEYVTLKDREKNLRELRESAKDATDIYLAPDPDREGEAIAWHLKTALKGAVPEDRFHRISYHEITETAIRKALDNVHALDMNMVNSQQARRVLDRIVGYKVSPLLWKRIRGASSAGRVQSAALRLVCDREKAILAFKPEEFWIIGARVSKQVAPKDPFVVRLLRINDAKPDIRTSEQAEAVRADLDDRPMRVTAITRREVSRRAPPPFITSTLQQAGSRACGFMPSRTMRLAQTLYEGVDLGRGPEGLITYMRTDSVAIAKEAQEAARRFIGAQYGDAFVPERPPVYRSRESAQEAHEAIRPTDVARTPESLSGTLKPDELRLYRLIWQRFVASQMAPAVIAQRAVDVEAVPPTPAAVRYLFRANASEIVFPGYLKVAGADAIPKPPPAEGAAEEAEAEEVEQLPQLAEGESLDRHEWLADQKFTQPPARYSDATLVRAMEEHGIGRPSTYSATVQVLYDRKYVEREKKSIRPTDLGMKANDFLAEHLRELFDVKFTASMEERLDEVEKGTVEWTSMLADFYTHFGVWMKGARGPAANPEEISKLVGLLSQVKDWPPGQTRGKREYGDKAFYESVAKQAAGGKAMSERQSQALKRLAWRYREQVPEIAAEAAALGLEAAAEAAGPERAPAGPPAAGTLERIALMAGVNFDPPRKARGRTYDDRAFFDSLRKQAEGGRELSSNQIMYLDRLLEKYGPQIKDFDAARTRLGIGAVTAEGEGASPAEAAESARLLEQMRAVTKWRAPQTKGNRTWDDREFFDSLDRQFRQRKSLSFRQLGALRKMAARYAKMAGTAAPAADAPNAGAGPDESPA